MANWICCKPYSEPLSGSTATNSTKSEITPLMARDNCFSTEDFWNLLGALTQMHERSSPQRERPPTSGMSDRWLVHAERRD